MAARKRNVEITLTKTRTDFGGHLATHSAKHLLWINLHRLKIRLTMQEKDITFPDLQQKTKLKSIFISWQKAWINNSSVILFYSEAHLTEKKVAEYCLVAAHIHSFRQFVQDQCSLKAVRAHTRRETSAHKKIWSAHKCSLQKCLCTYFIDVRWVLVKCCTKEILCALILWKIRGNMVQDLIRGTASQTQNGSVVN